MERRWYGEPALLIQGVAALLTVAVVFGWPGLDDHVVALITAVLTAGAAAWTALHVRPIAPTVFSALVLATATLLASFGAHLDQVRTGAITLAVAAFMAILTRAQQTPL